MRREESTKAATANIEAALYSSGRPMPIEEIIRASCTGSRQRTVAILESIMKKTRAAFYAIEVIKQPDGTYVLQLKPEYSGVIRHYASKPILPKATLKTLSYIAYAQPVSSKQLVEVRGNGVYGHLKELRQLNFIQYESVGRTKIFTTTEKFQKYFGISGEADTLKDLLFKHVRKSNVKAGAPAAS